LDRNEFTKRLQLAGRASFAAALSLAIAEFLRLEHPIYAMLAAVIVTELSPQETRRLALRRLVATAVGATCGALLVALLPPSPWTIGLGILVGMLLCDLVGLPAGARVAGYICGISMLAHGSDPWRYAFFRFVETVLGIAVAWLLSFAPKLLRVEEPVRREGR
jgi:uncharacterized membrane protein YgaE (UPF0421/DUF939 family)